MQRILPLLVKFYQNSEEIINKAISKTVKIKHLICIPGIHVSRRAPSHYTVTFFLLYSPYYFHMARIRAQG